MSLNENADLDSGQVEDLRGRRGRGGFGFPGRGGGMRIPLPRGKGGIGLVGMLVLLCLFGVFAGGNATGLLPELGDPAAPSDEAGLAETCARDNPDRFENLACRNLLYVNSIQEYWESALPDRFGVAYEETTTRYFSEAVSTGCGDATSGAGPFYCPADRHVYLDLTFYEELSRQFGASGEFAQAYVLAHEYGHHVQTLLGIEGEMRRAQQREPEEANEYSVMLELQADCLAGAWAANATETTDTAGQPLFQEVTDAHIAEALEAAAAIGDDAIQRQTTGQVNPEAFTHGTSAQRQEWFTTGYRTGDPGRCDTFGDEL